MKGPLRRRAEEVFQQVADLPPERRAAFLDEHCAAEPVVRAEVESLLVHFDNETIASLQSAPSVPPQESEIRSERVGPYKLLQLIGEGGFGSVYMAEQEQPVRRTVALKIIKLGMDTRQVIARFEAERQALAMMEHPNIARVLDAGATDTGRPYFVMELVKGIPITEYCDKSGLSTPQRLELFLQVCRAVQHAHQKGIIHRDIKPSNVLVTLHDGTAVPKVIDFGIAKATSQRLTDKTLFTEFLQFIGTPQYMSPEQAEMSGLDVDTRTDIYSLGVLLYELLTGTTPFDAKELRSAAFGDIQRIIREEDPPTPSKRVSTLGAQLAEVAKARQTEPATLSRLMRGDLDWIVMRALEKDRTRRYEAAAAMAADIQRHLSNEPVTAGPPGAGYRFRKFIRRHQVAVVAGSLVAAALLIGFALATTGFIQARRERDRALAAERLAQEQAENARAEAESAKAINAFFNDMLTSVDPMQVRLLSAYSPDESASSLSTGSFPRDVSVAEMVRQAATELDKAFAGKPELEAASRETIGMTLRGLGLFTDARPQLEVALAIRRHTLGKDHFDTLRSTLALGELLLDAGRIDEAEPLVRTALDGMTLLFGAQHPKTLSCASVLASVLSDQGRHEQADVLFEKTLEAQKRILGPEHRDTLATMCKWSTSCVWRWSLIEGQALTREFHDLAAKTLSPNDSLTILSKPLMGWGYLVQFRYDEAESLLRSELENCRRILGPQHPFTHMTMHGLARALQGADLQDQKEQLYRQALAGLRATRGKLHRHTMSVTQDFARWLDHRGEFAEADQLFRAVVAGFAESLGEGHAETQEARRELAAFLEHIGRIDEAVAVLDERLAIARRYSDAPQVSLSIEMHRLAHMLAGMGRIDGARELSRELLTNLRKHAERHSEDPSALNIYAFALLDCAPADLRDVATALPLAEKAVRLSEGKDPHMQDTLALAYHLAGQNEKAVVTQGKGLELLSLQERRGVMYPATLVGYLLKQGDRAAADGVMAETVEMFREALGQSNLTPALDFYEAGLILVSSGHYAMAERVLLEAVELNRELLGDGHERVATSLQGLGDAYHMQGKRDLAESAYRAVLAMRRELLGDDDLLVGDTTRALGMTLCGAGRTSEAASTLREALGIYRRLGASDIPAALSTQRILAEAMMKLGDTDAAVPLARDALAKTIALYGDHHLQSVLAMCTLGWLLVEQGGLDEAESLLRKCVGVCARLRFPEEQAWLAGEADGTLGYCLLAMRRFEEAESLLLGSYSMIQAGRGDSYLGTRTALDRIIALYEAWGKPEQATEWRTESGMMQSLSPQLDSSRSSGAALKPPDLPE